MWLWKSVGVYINKLKSSKENILNVLIILWDDFKFKKKTSVKSRHQWFEKIFVWIGIIYLWGPYTENQSTYKF